MIRIYYTAALLTFLTSSAAAQFELRGYAQYMPNSCIMLTPDEPYAEGIAYSVGKLDLNNYFEIEFDIYLGDKDSLGADGIAFVLHNDPKGFDAFGTFGEGIGYGRFNPGIASGNYIGPSIAVEFDTYQNRIQNDPACDHVAYLENGSSRHINYWNNNDANFNLEDDRMHNFRFRWNPEKREITVMLDRAVVYRGRRNLIQDIFGGQNEVIWGFTASTGRKYNLQYFCFRRIAYQPEAEDICPAPLLTAE